MGTGRQAWASNIIMNLHRRAKYAKLLSTDADLAIIEPNKVSFRRYQIIAAAFVQLKLPRQKKLVFYFLL